MYKSNQIEKQGYCVICLKSLFEETKISYLLNPNKLICPSCLSKFKEINKTMMINNIEVTFLYEYNAFMKKLLYQYKGCYDIALKDVFLNKHIKMIKRKYKKHTIVYPPSNEKDVLLRGFNHILKMCDKLNLKVVDMFYKNSKMKQADTLFKHRKNIEKVIEKRKDITIDKNEKYLIIDDVYTSGYTLKTIIKYLINAGVKHENIKALIIAKTADFVEL